MRYLDSALLASPRSRSLSRAAAAATSAASAPTTSQSSATSTITQEQFDPLIAQAKKSYEAQKRAVPEGRHDRVRDAEEPGGALPRPARRVRRRRRQARRSSHRQGGRRPADADQEAVLRRQRRALQEAAQAAGPDATSRSRDDIRAQLVSEQIFKKVTAGVKVDLRRGHHKYYNTHQRQYGSPSSATCAHPRQEEGARRPALPAASSTARTSRAREEVLAGPGLEEPGRQADDLEGTDGAAVRPDRVPAEDRRRSRSPSRPSSATTSSRRSAAIKPAKTTPFAKVKASIRQQLLQQKKNDGDDELGRTS